MKIRQGFVSNSSSSSFVVLLPENFDVNSIDYSEFQDQLDYHETDAKSVKVALDELIKNGYIWDERYSEKAVLEEVLRPYVIAEIDGGPDEGQIVLAKMDVIKNILSK